MKLETLQNLLSIEEDDVKKYDIEQLRLILGVARYYVRSIEREINRLGMFIVSGMDQNRKIAAVSDQVQNTFRLSRVKTIRCF